MKRINLFSIWLLAWVSIILAASRLDAAQAARVDVILWFDTEDYLLPASDDAAKRLAELLSKRDIRATFKVVGEKARVLERRGRADVIAALRKHDIGYHTSFHSVHPAPAEYLADCGPQRHPDGTA
jgi:peptidoglycan/xylan/chitin deacetylase (PgdA/CDA1 family)